MELYYNSEWGTVSNLEWDLNDAEVVCRELGFGPALAAKNKASFGQSSGQIWLKYVICIGTELSIGNCMHYGWGDCNNCKNAGVKCAASYGNFS